MHRPNAPKSSPSVAARLVRWAVVAGAALAALPAGATPDERRDAPGRPTPAPSSERLDGVVSERLEAGGYTYLRVRPSAGAPVWVVTMGAGSRVGARVRVTSFGEQRQFHSRRLNRDFDRVLFASVTPVPAL